MPFQRDSFKYHAKVLFWESWAQELLWGNLLFFITVLGKSLQIILDLRFEFLADLCFCVVFPVRISKPHGI